MLGHRPLTPEDYTAILKKRWWILAIPTLLLPILAYAASFLVSPQYVSQTLVLIEQQKVPTDYVKPVIEEDLNNRLASMKEQILSRSRLQPILERFDLFGKDHATMDDRIDQMRKDIDIKPIHSEMAHGLPGFFISFKAGDARTAQAVCEEITSMFTSENLRARAADAEGTTAFLNGQLADAKRSLDEQDAKLAKFQQEYVGKLPGQEEPNMNMLTSLNTQLEASTQQLARMEQDKSYEEALLAQQSRDVQLPAQERAAPAAQNAELQTLLTEEADLSTRYTDDYPDLKAVRTKIKEIKQQMAAVPAPTAVTSTSTAPQRNEPLSLQQLRASVRAIDQGIAQKRQAQAQLQAQIHLYQDRISSSPLVQEQYKQLTRDYQSVQQAYDDLLKRKNESKMATDLERQQQGEHFSVMDAANLPESPTSPKRPIFAGGGLVFGLALGLGIIGLLEYNDTALRSERDVWAFTKLPTLATISRLDQVTPAASLPGRSWRLRRRKQLAPSLEKPLVGAGG